MTARAKAVILPALPVLLLPICLVTGGTVSPARFFYYPLVALVSLFCPARLVILAGITFAVFFPLQHILLPMPPPGLTGLLVEISAFFLFALVGGHISNRMRREQFRYDNAIATFHSLSSDLSHKNRNLQAALDALSEANRKLREFDRHKTEFLSNVSHELRTPLSSIRSYSEILLNYDDIDPGTQREFLQTINAESVRLSAFVTEVLDLVRIESGKMEVSLAPVQPKELLEESARIVRPMASDKGLALIVEEVKGVPEVRGDKGQLIQVLVNLLNNAVKFTREGEIRLGAYLKGDVAEFYVSDTGEGIFPEEKEVIFEPFYRVAERALNRPHGSGLGLSISRSIVEFHGGSIWVESEIGKGSTFFFTVPLASEKIPGIKGFGPLPQRVAVGGARQILVLSSDMVSRRSLRKKLEDLGYMTLGADTPGRALDIVARMRPGLLVTEVPEDWESFEALVRWARDAGVRMLLTTLHVQSGDEPSLAVHGYISKPFDRYEIVSMLEPFRMKGGTILVISAARDDSRTLQVILGDAGYGALVFDDVSRAILSCEGGAPQGVIVGSFRKDRLEEILSALKESPRTRDLPVFLALESTLHRHICTVTLNPSSRLAGVDGLYKLIGEIEAEYSKGIG